MSQTPQKYHLIKIFILIYLSNIKFVLSFPMLSLSENGVRDLVNRKENPNGYLLQVLHIEAVDSHSYTLFYVRN